MYQCKHDLETQSGQVPELSHELLFSRRFYTTKLQCGMNILELTTYDGVSMWWIVDTLFYNFIRLKRANRKQDSQNVNTLICIYNLTGLRIVCIYDAMLNSLLRILTRLINHTHISIEQKSKIIMLTKDKNWDTTGDPFFNTTINKLRLDYDILGINIVDTSPIRDIKEFIIKRNSWSISYNTLNYYWSFSAWKRQKAAFRYFKTVWSHITKDETFKELCVINHEDLYGPIKAELKFYFFIILPLAVKYIEMGKSMMNTERPDLILLLNEYGWRERSYLVIPSKLKNIPSLAVQHGVIHPSHKGYIYSSDELSSDGTLKSPYCPIPDKIAVYGPYHHELLTQVSSYRHECVVVVGQPRYDFLSQSNELYSKDKFKDAFQLKSEHKIVLWTTQCHGLSDMENLANINTVFEAIKNLEDVTLIIKQHPSETEFYTKMIRTHMKTFTSQVILMPKNSNTFEQIYACDLLITKSSTTAMEAIAMDKPVIILNLSGVPDVIDYVEEGVAIGVYDGDNLKHVIERLLTDDSELAINRERYIEQHLFKLDGNATQRLENLIVKMIQDRR